MLARVLNVLLIASACGAAVGEEPSREEIVIGAKSATALVVVESERAMGTAFCIDSAGYFVTNQHVTGKERRPWLVLDSGLESERVIAAEVVRADEKEDLALLYAPGVRDLRYLKLGTDAGLVETSEVLVFGYPFGRSLRVKDQEYPSVSVSLGHITSLRRSGGELRAIQLDAEINPGNSGGPVLDASGRVIGVVEKKIVGTGINLAIPVWKLHKFLGEVEFAFDPPAVKLTEAHQPVDMSVQVAAFDREDRKLDVVLELSCGSGQRRRIELSDVGGRRFQGSVVPVPRMGDESNVQLEVRFASGLISCRTKNETVEFDGRKVEMQEISKIRRHDGKYTVTLISGEESTVDRINGLPTQADLGAYLVPVDLSKADAVSIRPLAECTVLDYTVIVSGQGEEIARREGKWRLVVPYDDKPVDGVPEDEVELVEFLPLTGDAPWPGFLESNSAGIFEEEGLRVQPNQCVRTESASLLTEDFLFEVELEFKSAGERVACVGIGDADGERGEPRDSVYLRLHAPYLADGEIGLSKHVSGRGAISGGHLRTLGPHRVSIEKRGSAVTFSVDVDSDGPTPDDVVRTIPDIRQFAPFLHEKNTHALFLGAGTYTKVRFQRFRSSTPKSAAPEAASQFVPWPEYLTPSVHAVVTEDGLYVGEERYVTSKVGGFAASEFTVELEFTLPTQGTDIGIIGFGVLHPGADHTSQQLEQTVYMRLHSLHHGEGQVGLNLRDGSAIRGRREDGAGRFRSRGPHMARIQRRGETLTFHIDMDQDGPSPDDITKTIPDIRTVLPFLHAKNTQLFFGSGTFRRIRLTQP